MVVNVVCGNLVYAALTP
nr:DUF3265 domain-containing protein [Vibrio vulnificus]